MCDHTRRSGLTMCTGHRYRKLTLADQPQHLRTLKQLEAPVPEEIINNRISWYRRRIDNERAFIRRLETHRYPIFTVVKYHLYTFVVKLVGQVCSCFVIAANNTSQVG